MTEATKVALFEKTMVPHMDAAYNLARWITGNAQDAEDIVQEAYLRALRYFDSFTGMDGRGWLLAIVRNTSLSWHRQQTAKPVEFDERVHSPESEQRSPEKTLISEASLNSLRECMEALPVEFRETLVMRELEEFSYQEIADVTAIPIGTVMSRLARARKRLIGCMAAKGEKA